VANNSILQSLSVRCDRSLAHIDASFANEFPLTSTLARSGGKMLQKAKAQVRLVFEPKATSK